MLKVVTALCPNGHAIEELRYESSEMTDLLAAFRLGTRLARAMIRLEIDPVCPVCGSEDLVYEWGPVVKGGKGCDCNAST